MTLAGLLNQACTITTRTDAGTKDRYGNPDITEATTTTVCYCEQRQRSEQSGEDAVASEDWLVMLPTGTTVDAHDKITVGSLVLEVVGPPWSARNPRTQSTSHIECNARKAG